MRNLFLTLIILPFSLIASNKYATFKNIKSELNPNQGFLAVVIDNSEGVEFYKFKLKKIDGFFTAFTFKKLSLKKQYALIKLNQGSYFWSKGSLRDQSHFISKNKEDTQFEIKAQSINYFGDLIINYDKQSKSLSMIYENRMSMMYNKLKEEAPIAFYKYPLVLSSKYPDPFAKFYHDL
ncbi:MAG TPA: hypothetical protein ENJ41_01945 [Oceanospirillales bacterium]|nr:hypothetical protein [Oceanospirillales bacterium]